MATDWKEALWDKMSDQGIRERVEKLPESIQSSIVSTFSHDELREFGWVEVCTGCGAETAKRDCGCPCGTGMTPPATAT
jgi:hypothetical protein